MLQIMHKLSSKTMLNLQILCKFGHFVDSVRHTIDNKIHTKLCTYRILHVQKHRFLQALVETNKITMSANI